jgi:hypothetical protein
MQKWWISESSSRQKELEEGRETSQAKRRRMLQFHSQDSDHSLPNMEMPSPCFKNVSAFYLFQDSGLILYVETRNRVC